MRSKLINRIISWLVAAVLVIGLLPVLSVPAIAADITFSGGNGTSGSPYQITTAAQLASLASEVNAGNTTYNAAYYKLMNDIDLTSYANWTPIGTSLANSFKGSFDGDGFVIRNLKITGTSAYRGLFGYVSGATVKNLGVVDANVVNGGYSGILAAYLANASVISNCYTRGSITIDSNQQSYNNIGGVVGSTDTTSNTLMYCYSTATVIAGNVAGGVVGNLNNGSMAYCFSTGAITITNNSNSGTGGVVGSIAAGGFVSNCLALNPSITINTGLSYGRVVGRTSGTYSGLYAFSGMTGNGAATSGTTDDKNGANATAANISNATWWTNTAGFTDANWVIAAGKLPILKTTDGTKVINGQSNAIPTHITTSPPFVGSGTSGAPYLIYTAEELAQLATYVNAGNTAFNAACYKLMNDIDISGYAQWTPIGNSSSTNPFKGTFDGDYHTIDGLTMSGSKSTGYHGLFGSTAAGSVIKNLGITNISINITSSTAPRVGGLMGESNSAITNCYTTGTITSKVTATNYNNYIGGIAGTAHGSSGIKNTYTTCNISSPNATPYSCGVGGLIGSNYTMLINCYATGDVTCIGTSGGSHYSGKLLGNNSGASASVTNCYSPQGVSTGLNKGIGSNNSGGTITGGGTTEATQAFANTLNANRGANADWSEWVYFAGKNGGYPVFGVSCTVTLNANGGAGTNLTSYISGVGATLPADWTKDGYTFGGWYDNSECSGDPVTEITSTDEGNKEYWAKWTLITRVTEINDNTSESGFAITSSNLDAVFDRVVTQADTADDNVVTLSLNISDIGGQTTETEAIKQVADKGSEVYFFDVTLSKSVDDGGGSPQTTTLTNIPVPVEVHIKLTGDLAGKAYYKVYRYHNGVAEQISNDTTKTEHYKVDVENSEIIIYTMKFSTYAIFGNDISLQDLTNGEDMDVQAKITDASLGVYKVDIAWGAMTFEWNASGQEWNPDTHAYDPIPGNGVWTDASHNGENNRIVCANHSNGSLLSTFDVSGTLGGVTYDVFTDNDVKDTAATDMSLPKVPNETATAPEIRAYLWLSGEPDSASIAMLNDVWQKVGVITVTFTPDMSDTEKTPKN